MEHEITEAILDKTTSIQTDRLSFIYECPNCKKQNRYAYPGNGEIVFCNGEDFGTSDEHWLDGEIHMKNILNHASILENTDLWKSAFELLKVIDEKDGSYSGDFINTDEIEALKLLLQLKFIKLNKVDEYEMNVSITGIGIERLNYKSE